MIDWTAIATFVLAAATLVLGFLTYKVAKATRDVAARTTDLTRVGREELRQLQDDARAAARPTVMCRLRTANVRAEGPRLAVELELLNSGGHASVEDRVEVTGSAPGPQTRPSDIYGLLPQGIPRPFEVVFDHGHTPEPYTFSIRFRTRGVRFGEEEKHLYHLKVERWSDPTGPMAVLYRAQLTPSRTPM